MAPKNLDPFDDEQEDDELIDLMDKKAGSTEIKSNIISKLRNINMGRLLGLKVEQDEDSDNKADDDMAETEFFTNTSINERYYMME